MSSEPVLKVWSLDKPVRKTGLPTCLSELRIKNGQKQFPVGLAAWQRELHSDVSYRYRHLQLWTTSHSWLLDSRMVRSQ